MNNTLTAMQTLLDEINYAIEQRDGAEGTPAYSKEVLLIIKSKATELLHKEKTDLAKSFLAGMNRVIGDRPNQPNFEDYYNKTFHNQLNNNKTYNQ